jgi:hypothetical protein
MGSDGIEPPTLLFQPGAPRSGPSKRVVVSFQISRVGVDSVVPDDPAPSGLVRIGWQNVGRIVQFGHGPVRMGHGRESWT